MNSFLMRQGNVRNIQTDVLGLHFNFEGVECKAVALKELCFVNEQQSTNLCYDFCVEDGVHFSAVLDPNSAQPDIWKVVTLWTSRKPLFCFQLGDWKHSVSELYRQKEKLFSELWSESVPDLKDSISPWKNVTLEEEAIIHVTTELKRGLSNSHVHMIVDNELDVLLSNARASVRSYVKKNYITVQEFLGYHSEVFSITERGFVFPAKSNSKACHYIQKQLPTKIQQFNENNLQTGKSNNSIVNSKNVCNQTLTKNMPLERQCVYYFANVLRNLKHNEGQVLATSSAQLKYIFDRAPKNIVTYISSHYLSLSHFLQTHNTVFYITKGRKIIARSRNEVIKYLENALPKIISKLSEKLKMSECAQNNYQSSLGFSSAWELDDSETLEDNLLQLERALSCKENMFSSARHPTLADNDELIYFSEEDDVSCEETYKKHTWLDDAVHQSCHRNEGHSSSVTSATSSHRTQRTLMNSDLICFPIENEAEHHQDIPRKEVQENPECSEISSNITASVLRAYRQSLRTVATQTISSGAIFSSLQFTENPT